MRLFGRRKKRGKARKKSARRRRLGKLDLLPPSQMFLDHPPGIRSQLLSSLSLKLFDVDMKQSQAYARAADTLGAVFSKRISQAALLEREGEIDKAIRIYQKVADDLFDGSYPYERLRILYSKRKEYDKAIRACQQYIEMANTLLELGAPREDELQTKKAKFAEWIPKLQKRLEKANSQRG